MASHFRWYPAESEVVVPFNARYSFPSQVLLTDVGQQGYEDDSSNPTKERRNFQPW